MKLYEIRVKKQISQSQVAKDIGISQQCYSRYERGEHEADYKTLIKLADYFDVSLDELLGRVETPQLFDDARVQKSEIQTIYDELPFQLRKDLLTYAYGCAHRAKNEKIEIE